MDHLCKLVKEAEDCGVVLTCDVIGATLAHRTGIAKAWLSRCRQVPHQHVSSWSLMQLSSDSILLCYEFVQSARDLLRCPTQLDDGKRISQALSPSKPSKAV